jgi:transcription elongation factor Elf1
MSDERSAHGRLRPDMAVKDEWVFKAYDQAGVDVANISSHDLQYFSTMSVDGNINRSGRVAPESLINRLVSANTMSQAAGSVAPLPFVVREVPSRQPGVKPVRVAFIGLTETTPAPPAGFKFVDPAEAAKRIVPEAKKQANLVVVLAKVTSQQEVARIAREAPGIDVIIDGNSQSVEDAFTPPVYVGQTLVVYTPFETRMLGELRFYRSAQGKFTTRQRFIVLDEIHVPEDPAAKQLVDAATKAETDARKNSRMLLENWLASSRKPVTVKSPDRDSSKSGSTPAYVASSACSKCHLAEYMKWTNSAHAHATDPLQPRPDEFEPSCLECHATGSSRASVANKLEVATLQNVQCEQCHGPGSDHVAKPAKGYGRVASMQSACANCHTSETSPAFDLQPAWVKIEH